MACPCSACTPKDRRILRFLPPSRPLNFYDSLGQITVSIHFFTFSKLSMLHHKKSSKMHTSLSIFAILRFIENNQKHAFLLQIVLPQNRDSYLIYQFRVHALFHSKKSLQKEQKITFPIYQWVKKAAEKPLFFVPKSCISTTKIASKSFIYTPGIDFSLKFFSQSKNRAKIMKKPNALIRLLRKNHLKTLLFLIKTTYFHAEKHQNLAKKIIPGPANGQACHRTFSR